MVLSIRGGAEKSPQGSHLPAFPGFQGFPEFHPRIHTRIDPTLKSRDFDLQKSGLEPPKRVIHQVSKPPLAAPPSPPTPLSSVNPPLPDSLLHHVLVLADKLAVYLSLPFPELYEAEPSLDDGLPYCQRYTV